MDPTSRWLLLIHQLPQKPNYFRVKIWRRLQRLGAVAVKSSVYVLPDTEQAREDFERLLREIDVGGGEAVLCEAHLVGGLSDDQVVDLFRSARDEEYAEITRDALSLMEAGAGPDAGVVPRGEIRRMKRRLAEVAAIDFFGAHGRSEAEAALAALEAAAPGWGSARTATRYSLLGKTWVTRKGVHVDRIASAWLVRRFVDPGARFRFVAGKRYHPAEGEVRFDMFEAEFTHEGDRCTFEMLLERAGLDDPALRSIAEIVHDIDLKDGKFGRRETPGVDRMIKGVAEASTDDEERIARGGALFDSLYAAFSGDRGSAPAE